MRRFFGPGDPIVYLNNITIYLIFLQYIRIADDTAPQIMVPFLVKEAEGYPDILVSFVGGCGELNLSNEAKSLLHAGLTQVRLKKLLLFLELSSRRNWDYYKI